MTVGCSTSLMNLMGCTQSMCTRGLRRGRESLIMKKLALIVLVLLVVVVGFLLWRGAAVGQWDAEEITENLSKDPYSNPQINAESATEQRLGVEWVIHRGKVEFEGVLGDVTVSQNADAKVAIIAYQGPKSQGFRIVTSEMFGCAGDKEFANMFDIYFGQTVNGIGGARFMLSPADIERIQKLKANLTSIDPSTFGAPCDTIAREMQREIKAQ